jgi:Predicted membrane protein (DUF2157)
VGVDAIPESQFERLDRLYRALPFSVFWELRTLLYLGVVLLSGGLGTLIYKNLDTLGHQAVLAGIALLAAGCLGYSAWKAEPFTWGKGTRDATWTDYVLLLGALLFGVFVGYLQYAYSVFGTRYGLALGLPGLVYLLLAYRFDHRGVLQMGIAGVAAAFGIAATPFSGFEAVLFLRHPPLYNALGVAAALALAGVFSARMDRKRHFEFSYVHFAVHLGMIAALTGMVSGGIYQEAAYGALLAAGMVALWKYAQRRHSYYFLLCATFYGYAGFTYVCRRWLFTGNLYLIYFLVSCGGAIYFFLNLKSFAGNTDAGVQEK